MKNLVSAAALLVALAFSPDLATAQVQPSSPQTARSAIQPRLHVDFGLPPKPAKPADKTRQTPPRTPEVVDRSRGADPIDCRMAIVPSDRHLDPRMTVSPTAGAQHHLRVVVPPQCTGRSTNRNQ
jgi:hypothetical protein